MGCKPNPSVCLPTVLLEAQGKVAGFSTTCGRAELNGFESVCEFKSCVEIILIVKADARYTWTFIITPLSSEWQTAKFRVEARTCAQIRATRTVA